MKSVTMAQALGFTKIEAEQFDEQVAAWIKHGTTFRIGASVTTVHMVGKWPKYKCFECSWHMHWSGPELQWFGYKGPQFQRDLTLTIKKSLRWGNGTRHGGNSTRHKLLHILNGYWQIVRKYQANAYGGLLAG